MAATGQDWECSLWGWGSGLPAIIAPDSRTHQQHWGETLQISVAGETLCQNSISLPFPLAVSKEHAVGGLATPKAGYAEAAFSQPLAVCHGMCSPERSGHVEAVRGALPLSRC